MRILFLIQKGDDEHADHCEDRGDSVRGDVFFGEVLEADESGVVVDDDVCILQGDECDEETDSDADRGFEGGGNGVEDGFTHFGEGEYEEDESFEEDGEERDLPGVAHLSDYCIGEVSVESHSRSEEEGEVCAERHDDGSGE